MELNKSTKFIIFTLSLAFLTSCILAFQKGLQTSFLGALMVIAMAFAYKYPRLGLWAFLIYMPFAGSISYSLASVYKTVGSRIAFSSDYFLFQIAKDAFYFPALFGIILNSKYWLKFFRFTRPLLWSVIALLGCSLLTLIFVNGWQSLGSHPGQKPMLMGLVGLKVLLGNIPLVFCGYFLIQDKKSLVFLKLLQVVITLICCILCLVQYGLLITEICAGNAGLPREISDQATLQAQCFVGGSLLYNPEKGLIRLPGTFVSPWHWGWFLIANTFFTFAAYRIESSWWMRKINITTILLLFLVTIISGQRTALILVPTIFLLLIIFNLNNKKNSTVKLGAIISFGIVITAGMDVVQQRVYNLISRWNYSPPPQFIEEQFRWILDDRLELLGHGLGKATSAARRLGNIKLIETFYVKLLYENGILGLIAFLSVICILTFLVFKAWRYLQDPHLKSVGIGIFLFILLIDFNPYYYPLNVDPVAVYYWLFAGIALKLPEIDSTHRSKDMSSQK